MKAYTIGMVMILLAVAFAVAMAVFGIDALFRFLLIKVLPTHKIAYAPRGVIEIEGKLLPHPRIPPWDKA